MLSKKSFAEDPFAALDPQAAPGDEEEGLDESGEEKSQGIQNGERAPKRRRFEDEDEEGIADDDGEEIKSCSEGEVARYATRLHNTSDEENEEKKEEQNSEEQFINDTFSTDSEAVRDREIEQE